MLLRRVSIEPRPRRTPHCALVHSHSTVTAMTLTLDNRQRAYSNFTADTEKPKHPVRTSMLYHAPRTPFARCQFGGPVRRFNAGPPRRHDTLIDEMLCLLNQNPLPPQ
ncbi:uncharacterized protein LAJ45_05487 [Morchella importuna]|uniref:uncharacterized protein n=1 Tax=Morchella importuna TaxID=1174673 RepID=UPI001E8D239C|nr:uncharacterized protein LAJ45_05487 [Morchella importuna]KAH8150276.1 hypothetical protein LAJ45_05487 [Morchella importuna]